jgi:hypothetical protein
MCTRDEVRLEVISALEERELVIERRIVEREASREAVMEQKLKTLASEMSSQLTAEIAALFRNGPVTRLENRMAAVEGWMKDVQRTLESIDENGCRKHYESHAAPVVPIPAPLPASPSRQIPKWAVIGLLLTGFLVGVAVATGLIPPEILKHIRPW